MRTHKTFTDKERLEVRINQLRNKMIQSAAATGLNSHRTINDSQKLDKLIVIYQMLSYNIEMNESGLNNHKII